MDRWKAEQGRGRDKRKIRRKKSKKKEDEDAWKGRKVAKHCVFPMIWGSGGSKSRLAKAAGAEPAGQMRDEKLHAVVARSTFRSQNVQNTPAPDHFWQLRCRKSARRCGAKHILKPKCTKHTRSGPLLAVETSKKCTPLWREAHFQVKMLKLLGFGPLLEVQMFRCRKRWKSARRCGAKHISKSKCTKHTPAPDHFWRFRCRFASLHYTTLHYPTLHYTTLQKTTTTTTQLQSTTLHYTKLHYTTLHYTTLHYTTLHYITLH